MRKLAVFFLVAVMIISATACSTPHSETLSSSVETTSPPSSVTPTDSTDPTDPDQSSKDTIESITVSEFFDSFTGTPELFYYGEKPAKDSSPFYVLCIKDKQVMAIPNVADRTYGDFDGLSDEAVIAMLTSDVGTTFRHDFLYVYLDLPLGDFLKYRDFSYNISTDDSGNAVQYESLVIPQPYSLVGCELNLDSYDTYRGKNQEVVYATYSVLDYRIECETDIVYFCYEGDKQDHFQERYEMNEAFSWPRLLAFEVSFNNGTYLLGSNCPSQTVYNTDWYQIAEQLYSRSNYSELADSIHVDYADIKIDRSNERINVDACDFWGVNSSQIKGVEMFAGISKDEAIALLEEPFIFNVEKKIGEDGFFHYYLDGIMLDET